MKKILTLLLIFAMMVSMSSPLVQLGFAEAQPEAQTEEQAAEPKPEEKPAEPKPEEKPAEPKTKEKPAVGAVADTGSSDEAAAEDKATVDDTAAADVGTQEAVPDALNETAEGTAGDKEEKEEVRMPAVSGATAETDRVRATFSWDEGVFPEGATPHIKDLSHDKAMSIAEKGMGGNVTDAAAIDITFSAKVDGKTVKDIKPAKKNGVHVDVQLKHALEGKSFAVVCQDSNGDASVISGASAQGASFNANNLSLYSVGAAEGAAEGITEEPGSEEPGAALDAGTENSDDADKEDADAEEPLEDNESEVKEEYPAISETTTTNGGVTVSVEAPEGAFPEGTKVVVRDVDSASVIDAASDVLDGDAVDAKAVDISFVKDGEELEPANGKKVSVSLKVKGLFNNIDGDDHYAVHIKDNGKAEIINSADVTAKRAEFKATDFSVYAIVGEGHYDRIQITFKNGSNVLERQIVHEGDEFTEPNPTPQDINKTRYYWMFGNDESDKVEAYSGRALTASDIAALKEKGTKITDDDEQNLWNVEANIVWRDGFRVYFHQGDKGSDNENIICDTIMSDASFKVSLESATYIGDPQARLAGWKQYDGETQSQRYETTDTIEVRADTHLYPDLERGAWLSYDVGKGVKSIESEFIAKNEDDNKITVLYSNLPSDSTLGKNYNPGYAFDGWYKHYDQETGEYTDLIEEDFEITSNTVIYAKWKPTTAKYTVIHMIEGANGLPGQGNYTQYSVESLTGTTGNVIPVTNVSALTSAGYHLPGSDENYTGSGYSVNAYEENQKEVLISGDGKAVKYVYHNRDRYRATFSGVLTTGLVKWGEPKALWDTGGKAQAKCVSSSTQNIRWEVNSGTSFYGKNDASFSRISNMGDKASVTAYLVTYNFKHKVIEYYYYECIPGVSYTGKTTKNVTLNGVKKSFYLSFVSIWNSANKTATNSNYTRGYQNIDNGCLTGWAYRDGSGVHAAATTSTAVTCTGYTSTYNGTTYKCSYDNYIKRGSRTLSFANYDGVDSSADLSSKSVLYQKPLTEYDPHFVVGETTRSNAGKTETFAGWFKSAAAADDPTDPASETSAVDFSRATMPSANITYYAGWVPVEYEITFDANGGTFPAASGEEVSETLTQKWASGEVLSRPVEPTKVVDGTQMQFYGWYQDKDLRKPVSFGTFTVSKDQRLYAKWVSGQTHTLDYYDASGNKIESISGTRYFAGAEVSLASAEEAGIGASEGDNTVLTGWSTEQGNSGKIVPNNITMNRDYDLYAVTEDAGYPGGPDVDLKKNYPQKAGGNNDTFLTLKTRTSNDQIQIPGSEPSAPQASGVEYVFKGWSTETDGTGATYKKDDYAGVADGSELYAMWSELYADGKDHLFYNENTGTGSMDPTPGDTYSKVNAAGNDFTKSGYSFTGWNTEADGSGTGYQPGAAVRLTPEDDILYAQWERNEFIVEGLDNVEYNGAVQKRESDVVVKDKTTGEVLTKDTDYTLVYTESDSYKDVGSYTVTVKGAGNYQAESDVQLTYEIIKADLMLKPKDKSIAYGDSAPSSNEWEVEDGLKGSDTASVVSGTASYEYWRDDTPAGSEEEVRTPYQAGFASGNYFISMDGSALSADNYDIVYDTAMLAVGKKKLTITADDKTITYGDAVPAYTVTYDGFISGETESKLGGTLGFTCNYEQYSDAEEYTIIPSGLTSDNYDIEFKTGTLTVNRKVLGLEWATPDSLSYSGSQLEYAGATLTGIANEDDVTLTGYTGSKTGTNVGDYTLTAFTLGGSKAANYALPTEASHTWHIVKADNEWTSQPAIADWYYGKPASTPTAASKFGTPEFTYSDAQDGTYSETVPTQAGTYYMKAYVAGTDNYNELTKVVEFKILPQPVTITAADKASMHLSNLQTLTWTVTSDNGDYTIPADIDTVLAVTASTDATPESNVGTYDITPSYTSNPNYSVTVKKGTYSITNYIVKFSAAGYSGAYDGDEHGISIILEPEVGEHVAVYYSSTKELNESNYTTEGTRTAPTFTGAGEHTVYFYVVAGQNYSLEDQSGITDRIEGSKIVSITKVELTATAIANTITYGDAPAGNGVTITGFVNNEGESVVDQGSLDYDFTYNRYDNVGTYSITPKGLDADNYSFTYVPGALTVEPREVSLRWADGPVFNDQLQTYSGAIVEGLVNGDEITVGTYDGTRTGKDAGSYDITAATLAGAKAQNYKLPENTSHTWRITTSSNEWKTPPAISGWTYGDDPSTPVGAAKYQGPNDPTVKYRKKGSLIWSEEVPTEAGDYEMQISVAETDNYQGVTSDPVEFTIARKSVGIVWDSDDTRTYDGTEQIYAGATITGALNGDELHAVYTAESYLARTDAGNYTVTVGAIGDNTEQHTVAANYQLPTDGLTHDWVIDPVINTWTTQPSIEGWTYGDTPTITGGSEFGTVKFLYRIKGSTGEDAWSETAPTDAGDYEWKAVVEGDGNYSGLEVTGEFTIARKTVKVTADDKSKTMGEKDPELTVTVNGLIGDDTLEYNVSRETGEAEGTYKISVTGEAVQNNYSVSYEDGAFTIASFEYFIYVGANQTYTKGSGKDIVITAKRSVNDETCYSHFRDFTIDGKTFTRGTDYTAESGSTIVTIKASALDALETGTKKATYVFDDGAVSTNLTIVDGADTDGDSSSGLLDGVKTGDSTRIILWTTALILALALIALMLIISGRRRRKADDDTTAS